VPTICGPTRLGYGLWLEGTAFQEHPSRISVSLAGSPAHLPVNEANLVEGPSKSP